jgi:hypothetical protein
MMVRRLVGALGVVLVALVAGVGFVATVPPAGADGGRFRFSADVVDASEGQGFARVSVERLDLPVSRATVEYRTRPGSASDGTDFEATQGTLVFDVGATSASFVVVVRDDSLPEPSEELATVLQQGPSVTASAVVRILDDDATARPASSASAPAGGATSAASGAAVNAAARPSIATPTTMASVAAPSGRVATSGRVVSARPATSRSRRVTVHQSPVTPFELRPAAPSTVGDDGPPAAVDPILAIAAALLVGRVAADVWFRLRAGPA